LCVFHFPLNKLRRLFIHSSGVAPPRAVTPLSDTPVSRMRPGSVSQKAGWSGGWKSILKQAV
jgi:hypothetical protein